MKHALLTPILLFSVYINIFAGLTQEQRVCFDEFLSHVDLQKEAINALSDEVRQYMNGGIMYIDAEEEVTNAVKQFVEEFFKAAKNKGIVFDYGIDFVAELMLQCKIDMQNGTVERPTAESSDGEVRMYVYSQLSIEDKRTVYKPNYLANPKAAEDAFAKCSRMYADMLVELKRLPDTQEARYEAARVYLEARISELKFKYS